MGDVAVTLELLRDLGDAAPVVSVWTEDPRDDGVPVSEPPYAFTRHDGRASAWRRSDGEWVCGPPDETRGDFSCAEGWGRRGFVTAEDAMRYADVALEKEDRRG